MCLCVCMADCGPYSGYSMMTSKFYFTVDRKTCEIIFLEGNTFKIVDFISDDEPKPLNTIPGAKNVPYIEFWFVETSLQAKFSTLLHFVILRISASAPGWKIQGELRGVRRSATAGVSRRREATGVVHLGLRKHERPPCLLELPYCLRSLKPLKEDDFDASKLTCTPGFCESGEQITSFTLSMQNT